jgi:basic amino acid/polyamine antiporter, APA family
MGFKKFLSWFTGESKKAAPVAVAPPKPVPGQPASTPAKPVEYNSRESTGKKKLGYFVILFILINSILGSSLFYLPSLGVISSGAASLIAWILLFLSATIMMLYIGELVTLHPTSGGTYEFTKRAYGRFGGFFSGWVIWIAGNVGMALNLVAAAQYFIPEQGQAAFYLQIGFAALWILVLNFMAYRGIDAGATMLVAFGIVATLVVLGLIIPSFVDFPSLFSGSFKMPFDVAMLTPFFRHETSAIIPFLGLSLLLISEAFIGFEAVSYMANEVKEPKKLHRVMIAAMAICGVVVVLFILSSLGTVPFEEYVSDARPFALQALNTLGQKGQDFIVFGMYLVIVGAAAAWPITGSRLLNAMSRDKLFIKQLGKIHPKHKSPTRAVLFQTLVVLLVTWLIFRGYTVGWQDPYRTIYLIYVLLSLLALSLVLLTVPILRRKEKDLERPFKAPFGTIGPIFFVTVFVVLIGNWIWIERGLATTILNLTGSLLILGLPFYLLVQMFYDPKAITNVNEKLSFLVVLGEKLFFPFSIRNKLLKDMGDVKGKSIMEYGCAVGGLTKRLAPLVGPTGRIFATDLSLKKVEIVKKRIKKHAHVTVQHHPHLDDFKLELPHQVDGVMSIGMLSYMQKPAQILKSLAKHVKPGGEIVFLDYDKFFYFIPNVEWIQNDYHLKKIFSEAGFAVNVERRHGLLWTYVIIYGEKV